MNFRNIELKPKFKKRRNDGFCKFKQTMLAKQGLTHHVRFKKRDENIDKTKQVWGTDETADERNSRGKIQEKKDCVFKYPESEVMLHGARIFS